MLILNSIACAVALIALFIAGTMACCRLFGEVRLVKLEHRHNSIYVTISRILYWKTLDIKLTFVTDYNDQPYSNDEEGEREAMLVVKRLNEKYGLTDNAGE